MSGFLLSQHSEGFSAQEQDPALPLTHQLSHPVVLRSTATAAPAAQRAAHPWSEAVEQPMQKLKTYVENTDVGSEGIIGH
ncbi:hypothetical protein AS188_01125 [Kocuria flava]|uniref:Uncharacterized protein n=1 Tax=Kocuria flava TaxID=446860 RepID=A0A0U3HUM9_9MICC|nr:hypothetical protein [Kocuria flava]ALU38583.1 hypothetical protein AS188_01125 [Kocuria flava]GEO93218.1 hypothetical protein KFL01_25240 [Kocuria flava]